MKIYTLAILIVCSYMAAANYSPGHRIVAPEGIVGGKQSELGALPYQILLIWDKGGNLQSICGGALIIVKGRQFVITAAHCLYSNGVLGKAQDFRLVAGDHNRRVEMGNEQDRKVAQLIPHEKYSSRPILNDIALLVPDKPFKLTKEVRPINLPKPGQKTKGDVLASGWGRTMEDSKSSDYLMQVRLPVVDFNTCKKAYESRDQHVGPGFFCAGVAGKDTCQGDSGGPVVSISGNYLAGVVSWAIGCARPGLPGLSTEVFYYMDWINKKAALVKPTSGKNRWSKNRKFKVLW